MAEAIKSSLEQRLEKRNVPLEAINKFVGYIYAAKQAEANKEKKPVSNNSEDSLVSMFMKWWGLDLTIDGVNVVITGKGVAMPTYIGYKNKVRKSYPDARFDVQLVRAGDEFKVSKKNGKIEYSHDINDPFGAGEIIGAYCVITLDDAQYFEALNQADYKEMKNSSRQSRLWDTWESEFWLKSVVKRACKRHFYDEIKEIDEVDNDEFGLRDNVAPEPETEHKIKAAKTSDELLEIIDNLSATEQAQATPLVKARLAEIKAEKAKQTEAKADEKPADK